jgi:RNA polymerase sigma factor (sigma-70 family)
MAVAAGAAPVGAGRSDDELVDLARRGDDRAFGALYERYQGAIATYIGGMLGDHAVGEDLAQDAFLSALRRMRATTGALAFKPWIYTIARHAAIDHLRRRRRQPEVPIDAHDVVLAPADQARLTAHGACPEANALSRERLEHLRFAFSGLSRNHHRIIVLRELEGLTYREIAARMNLSHAAVESTLFRARKRLGEEFAHQTNGTGDRARRRHRRATAHATPARRAVASAA